MASFGTWWAVLCFGRSGLSYSLTFTIPSVARMVGRRGAKVSTRLDTWSGVYQSRLHSDMQRMIVYRFGSRIFTIGYWDQLADGPTSRSKWRILSCSVGMFAMYGVRMLSVFLVLCIFEPKPHRCWNAPELSVLMFIFPFLGGEGGCGCCVIGFYLCQYGGLLNMGKYISVFFCDISHVGRCPVHRVFSSVTICKMRLVM